MTMHFLADSLPDISLQDKLGDFPQMMLLSLYFTSDGLMLICGI